MTKTLLTTLVFMSAVLRPLLGQWDDESARETLAGLNGVYVLVDSVEDEARRDGLSRDQIQTDVELRLRQAGISVLTRDEALSKPGAPYLYINAYTAKNPLAPLYGYSLIVELFQRVSLVRNPSARVVAPTWSAHPTVGSVGSHKLTQLRDTIRDLTDAFINAYLAANPKR